MRAVESATAAQFPTRLLKRYSMPVDAALPLLNSYQPSLLLFTRINQGLLAYGTLARHMAYHDPTDAIAMADAVSRCLHEDGSLRSHEERHLAATNHKAEAAARRWDHELTPTDQEQWIRTLAALHDEHAPKVWAKASDAKRQLWVTEARAKFIDASVRELQVQHSL